MRGWPFRLLGAVLAWLTTRPVHAEGMPAAPPMEVSVLGERGVPVGKRDPTGASYVLRDALRVPGMSMADVLASVVGVQVGRTGSNADLATMRLRGAQSASLPVYLAGVRLNDDVTGTADLSLVPLWMIQRAEVYRSGAPLEADRMEPGGAVFFEPRLPRRSRGGAGFGVGSFGEHAVWGMGEMGDERSGALVALRRESAQNDYPYPTGAGPSRRANADFTAYDAWTIARTRLGRAVITTMVNGFVREQGLTGFFDVPAREARSRVQRMLGMVMATTPCGTADRCILEFQSALLLGTRTLGDPLHELGLPSQRITLAGSRVEQAARLRYRWSDALVLGAAVTQEIAGLQLDASSDTTLRARRATSRAALSVEATLSPRWSVSTLCSAEWHGTHVSGGAMSTSAPRVLAPSARGGVRVQLAEGIALLANLGRYSRVPTLGELYGLSAFVLGEPTLLPEQGMLADLGARGSLQVGPGEVYAEVFGFARLASQLIGYRRTGPMTVRPYNIGRARILGLELLLGGRLWNHVKAEVALTLEDPRDTTEGHGVTNDVIPFDSRFIVAPRVEVLSSPLRAIALERASLAVRALYRSSYGMDPAGLRVVPAQAPLGMEATLVFWGGRLQGRAALEDLVDTPRVDMAGMPLPGRSFHASLEGWW